MLMGLGLAGLAAVGSCWLTGRLSRNQSFGAVDYPSGRSLHAMPTPRTGGIAIMVALSTVVVIGLSLTWLVDRPELRRNGSLGIVLLATGVLAGHSYKSDLRESPALVRLGLQVALGTLVVWCTRLTVDAVRVPGWETLSLGQAAFPLTVLGLLWTTNLYNFMDGMDGFAGGMTVVGFSALAAFSFYRGEHAIGWLALFVVGSSAGFLVHNYPPARIFLGDVGSVSLGFLAGCLSLLGIRDGLFDFWVPILIFSPFIVDATITLIRRFLRGERVWRPHREHYYQRLVLAGWGHERTVLAEYALMVASVVVAVAYAVASEATQLCLLALWSLMYCCFMCGVRKLEIGRSRR